MIWLAEGKNSNGVCKKDVELLRLSFWEANKLVGTDTPGITNYTEQLTFVAPLKTEEPVVTLVTKRRKAYAQRSALVLDAFDKECTKIATL